MSYRNIQKEIVYGWLLGCLVDRLRGYWHLDTFRGYSGSFDARWWHPLRGSFSGWRSELHLGLKNVIQQKPAQKKSLCPPDLRLNKWSSVWLQSVVYTKHIRNGPQQIDFSGLYQLAPQCAAPANAERLRSVAASFVGSTAWRLKILEWWLNPGNQ